MGAFADMFKPAPKPPIEKPIRDALITAVDAIDRTIPLTKDMSRMFALLLSENSDDIRDGYNQLTNWETEVWMKLEYCHTGFGGRNKNKDFQDDYHQGSINMLYMAAIQCVRVIMKDTLKDDLFETLIPRHDHGKGLWDGVVYAALIKTRAYMINPIGTKSIFVLDVNKNAFIKLVNVQEADKEAMKLTQEIMKDLEEPLPTIEPVEDEKKEESKKQDGKVNKKKDKNMPIQVVANQTASPVDAADDHPHDDGEEGEAEDPYPQMKAAENFGFKAQKKGYMRMVTFGDAMKDLITDVDGNPIPKTTVINVNDPWAPQNTAFLNAYPEIQKFYNWILEDGSGIRFYQIALPIGEMIGAEIALKNGNVKYVAIDPNVLYKNGYNVLDTTHACNGTGTVTDEMWIPLKDKNKYFILKMIKGSLSNKDLKKINKNRPAHIKEVYDIVGFNRIGMLEPLGEEDWKKLVDNLYWLINKAEINTRVSIVDYQGCDKFRLVANSMTAPLTYEEADRAKVRPMESGDELSLTYDPAAIGENKYVIEVKKGGEVAAA